MILIAFAPLPEPVHEQPVRQVHHRYGSQHDKGQAGSRKPGEKPSEQRRAAERLASKIVLVRTKVKGASPTFGGTA